ncbi:tripartite tricarboxylate transporter substrate binding protein [Alcaligenaceae bacterium]|nr:tripartite tricarboxylate transporter substrate binding protein [Alcaligenaceae bacterium]
MHAVRKCLAKMTVQALTALVLGNVAMVAGAADASSYPNRPVHLVVPFPAGGGADTVGRFLGAKLAERLGQTVIIENKGGASGAIGAGYVANAKPDGLTLLLGTTPLIQAPVFFKDLPYDAFRDFEPVARIALSADVLIVPASSGIESLAQLVEAAKKNPGKYNYGTYGNATSAHMHGELLNYQKNIELLHIPYKGTAPLMQDFLGGQLTIGLPESVGVRAHLDNPKLKALAVSGEQRLATLPDTPTFTELGYTDFEPNGWYGIVAPAGTSPAIVNKLSTILADIMAQPDVQAQFIGMGLSPGYGNAKQLKDWMQRDSVIWARMAKLGNIKVQ